MLSLEQILEDPAASVNANTVKWLAEQLHLERNNLCSTVRIELRSVAGAVHAGNDSQFILGAPQSIGASVRMAFHLCKNDFDKAMRLLSRRCNIVARDYVCMTIDEIAQRLTKEGKTNELMQLDPVRWTSPD